MTRDKVAPVMWGARASDPGTVSLMQGTSAFGRILKRAVDDTPGALGGAFADADGEMIDGFTTGDTHQWALLTAHYGVVLGHIHAAFGTWHFGGPEYFIAQHSVLLTVVYAVDAGYYALLALDQPGSLARALTSLREAAKSLRKEMM